MQLICDELERTAYAVLSEVAPCLRRPRIVFAMRGFYFVLQGGRKMTKPIILTGDRPTGQLHIGHYVGFVEESSSYAK